MLKSTVRALQAMFDGQRVLAIAVQAGDAPYAGLLPFVPLPDHSAVLVHASRLSRHSLGLLDGAHVGVLVHEPDVPENDPLQLKRVMFDCVVRPLERKSDAWLAGRALYLARFPGSRITFNLGDFTLHRLELQSGLYVAGFGRAMEIAPRDIARLALPA